MYGNRDVRVLKGSSLTSFIVTVFSKLTLEGYRSQNEGERIKAVSWTRWESYVNVLSSFSFLRITLLMCRVNGGVLHKFLDKINAHKFYLQVFFI